MKEKTLFLAKESSEKYNLCLKDIESLKIYRGKFIEISAEYKGINDRYNNLIKDNEELLVKYKNLVDENNINKDNYDIIFRELESIKNNNKNLLIENNDFKDKYNKLNDDYYKIIQDLKKIKIENDSFKKEKEELNQDLNNIIENNNSEKNKQKKSDL